MNQWKTWESKNDKYVIWYQNRTSAVLLALWNLLQEKTMALVPSPSQEDDILLDVGCGDGRYLISNMQSKGYVGIGIDPNTEVSLLPTKNRIEKAGFKATMIRSVGEYIPLKASTVSIAFCNSALDHSMEPIVLLKEIHRTLKENGTLILWQGIYRKPHYEQETSEGETHLRVFTKENLVGMLREAGFSSNNTSLLGCNLILSSESYKSISSRIPKFTNKFLPVIIEVYLFAGKLLPKYASIVIMKMNKSRKNN